MKLDIDWNVRKSAQVGMIKVIKRRFKFMADIKYEIKETVGVIAELAKGWKT